MYLLNVGGQMVTIKANYWFNLAECAWTNTKYSMMIFEMQDDTAE